MAENKSNIKIISQNKKARHEYFILETYECGIELFGTEVKSVRDGKVNITDAYAGINNGEVWIKGMNISPFEKGNIWIVPSIPSLRNPGGRSGIWSYWK